MTILTIRHVTTYHYKQPVAFGEHRMMLRPRDDGGQKVLRSGIAITPDGKYAAITGAPRGQPNSGMLWIVDLAQRKAVGRVSGVGNETYLLALLP